jgi:guanylate kinase
LWLAAEVDARHYNFTTYNVFDSLDSQQNFLLMTQLHDANVLEILLVELCRIANCLKALLLQGN